jgi:hypothetical protein
MTPIGAPINRRVFSVTPCEPALSHLAHRLHDSCYSHQHLIKELICY